MKTKIIIAVLILGLFGCKKEPEPSKIEISFEGNDRIEFVRFEINHSIHYKKLPYKYTTESSYMNVKIQMCCLDKFRPSTMKVQIHDNNKQVYIHDIISQNGSIDYEYKYARP